MFSPLFRLVALRSDPGVLIVSYHRVLSEPDPLLPELPDTALFARQIDILAQAYEIVPFLDALEKLRSGRLRRPVAVLTFDDGYRDNFDNALPVLRARRLPATFFIATAYLDGGCMFSDRVIEAVRRSTQSLADLRPAGLSSLSLRSPVERSHALRVLCERLKYMPPEARDASAERIAELLGATTAPALMMTREQVRRLHAEGMSLGSHTHRHVILSTVSHETAEREIARAQDELHALSGERPRFFAYPNGRPGADFDPSHFAVLARLGLSAAVSSRSGFASPASNVYELPRFSPWDRSPLRFRARLALNMLRAEPFGLAQVASESL